MNRGREDAKKGPQGSKPSHNERPSSGTTSTNAWFAQRQSPNLRILTRDHQGPPSSKPQPNLEDKSLWPTLGASGPKYAEPGRPQSAKVLRQPVNLKPDGSNRSFIPKSSMKQGDGESWTSVASRKSKEAEQPTERRPQPQISRLSLSDIQETRVKNDRVEEKRKEVESNDDDDESWIRVTSRKEKPVEAEEDSPEQTENPASVKPELTEAEKEALRELRRERRQKEKAFKKKKREEEKRRKIYEPKSVKIQFIGQEVLQQVRENKSGSSSKSSQQQPKLKKDVKLESSYPEYRAKKSLGFLDEEYPSLTQKILPQKESKISAPRSSSGDTSGSEWETEDEEMKQDSVEEKDETSVIPEQILVESEDQIKVKPILKQKADSDSAKTHEPKQKSFADILVSKSNTVNPANVPSNVKLSLPQQQSATAVPEVKKVKRKDPITLDLFEALQVSTTKRIPATAVNKSGHILGSKLSVKNRSLNTPANAKYVRAGNILDSSAPTKRRGKERERPRSKRPSKMKRIILKDRQKRTELRRILSELSQPKSIEQTESVFSGQIKDEPIVEEQTKDDIKKEDFPNTDPSPIEAIPTIFSQTDENKISNSEENEKQGKKKKRNNKNRQKTSKEKPDQKIVDKPSSSLTEDNADRVAVPPVDQIIKQILEETPMQKAKRMIHSRKFREYCDHVLNEELNKVAMQLMDDLVRFQDRVYFKDPVKAKTKRRYVAGLREIKKFLTVKKISALLLAPDVERVESEGGLNDLIADLRDLASANGVPCFFVLNRFKLGKACKRKVGVSAIGILNYQGSEANVHKMMEILEDCKLTYKAKLEKALIEVGGSLTPPELPPVVPKTEEPQSECDDLSKKLIKLLR